MPSYYEALPIFRAAMDAAVRVDAAVQRFPKGHKYALGGKLRDASADLVALERSELSGNVKRRELAYLFEPVTGSSLEES